MFAVVILGVGFILIAAIFPVAIQQTSATTEESSAAAIARQAAASIAALPTTYANPNYVSSAAATLIQQKKPLDYTTVPTLLWFPPTVKDYVLGAGGYSPKTIGAVTVTPFVAPPPAVVVPFLGARWDLMKANTILPNDSRYAYAAFYKRESNSSVAEIIVVAMICRNRSTYDPTLDEVYYPGPRSGNITVTPGDFPNTPTPTQDTVICPATLTTGSSAFEGAYLQIPNFPAAKGLPVGRTYTLGQSAGLSGFEIIPGDSVELTPGTNGSWGTSGAITDPTSKSTPPLISSAAQVYSTGTLQATVAYATLTATPTSPAGRITLTSGSGGTGSNNPPPPSAAPGAFIIIADDCPRNPSMTAEGGGAADYRIAPNVPGYYTAGALNGRIFRLGRLIQEDPNMGSASYTFSPGTYDLDPQYGMRPAAKGYGVASYSPDTVPNPQNIYGNGLPVKVYIIGAGRTDPTITNSGYTGPAQDIGAYATYMQVQ